MEKLLNELHNAKSVADAEAIIRNAYTNLYETSGEFRSFVKENENITPTEELFQRLLNK